MGQPAQLAIQMSPAAGAIGDVDAITVIAAKLSLLAINYAVFPGYKKMRGL